MERAHILEHLAETERHVAAGEKLVARQREILDTLVRQGHEATDARTLLHQLEQTQALHIIDRDRLRAELAAFDRSK